MIKGTYMRAAYNMAVFSICQFFGRHFGSLNKKWLVCRSPNRDRKTQYLIENTTVTVFIQKYISFIRFRVTPSPCNLLVAPMKKNKVEQMSLQTTCATKLYRYHSFRKFYAPIYYLCESMLLHNSVKIFHGKLNCEFVHLLFRL